MSLILKYKTVSSAAQAFELVKNHLTPDTLSKFKVSAQIEYNESLKIIEAKGKGFSLNVHFYEDQAKVDLDLSFLFRAAKGAILSKIEKMFQAIL